MGVSQGPGAGELRYFEDFAPGQSMEFGAAVMEERAIVDFARRFDPQPFHLDREAARRSIFGGIIASGWHTGSTAMRLLVDHLLSRTVNLGSPGMDEVRWPRPVRPGDTLSVRIEVLDTVRSRSKPDRGLVRASLETLNQHRDVVMSLKMLFLVRCRAPA